MFKSRISLNLWDLGQRHISRFSFFMWAIIGKVNMLTIDWSQNMGCQYILASDEERLKALKIVPALWPALAVSLWKQLLSRADILDIITPVVDTCQVNTLSRTM